MLWEWWWRGVVLGFSIAAPVGPIGVLVIRRTLAEGRLTGLLAGLGAATADALYGLVGGLGLTVVATLLVDQQGGLRLLGGLFLCYLGLRTLRAAPVAETAPLIGGSRVGAYLSTFFLTLTNPVTILAFAAIFAGLGAGQPGATAATAALVGGVWAGSALWWGLLSSGVSLLRARLSPRALRGINVLSGGLLVGFGLLALVGARG